MLSRGFCRSIQTHAELGVLAFLVNSGDFDGERQGINMNVFY